MTENKKASKKIPAELFAFALVMLCAFPAYAQAQPETSVPSLFFGNDEIARIDKLGAKTPPDLAAPAQDEITLGAILYFGPGNWTVWLQGERWTPATNRPDLLILDVNSDRIRLAIPHLSGNSRKEITLHPHQSYNRATGEIANTSQ